MPAQLPSTSIEQIPQDELQFDRQNPRLVGYGIRANTPDEEIIKTLWQEMAVDEVAMSIAASGYWQQEPLIIAKEGGKWVVIEGNRRLAAVRILLNPKLAKEVGTVLGDNLKPAVQKTLEKLPVIKSNREDSWRYLGFRHVNGPARWGSFAKAEYIRFVHEEYEVSLADIASQIGDRHRTVQRLYRALMVLRQAGREKVFSPDDRTKKNLPFSHLYTALDYEGFQSFLKLRPEEEETNSPIPKDNLPQLGQVMVWLFGNRNINAPPLIFCSQDIERLSKVLSSDDARKALCEGVCLNDAVALVDPPSVRIRASLLDAKTRLETAYDIIRKCRADEEDIRLTSDAVVNLARRLNCQLTMN